MRKLTPAQQRVLERIARGDTSPRSRRIHKGTRKALERRGLIWYSSTRWQYFATRQGAALIAKLKQEKARHA